MPCASQEFTQDTFGINAKLPSEADFIDWAYNFTGAKLDEPTVMSYTTRPYYSNVQGVGDAFATIDANIKAFTDEMEGARCAPAAPLLSYMCAHTSYPTRVYPRVRQPHSPLSRRCRLQPGAEGGQARGSGEDH